MFVDFVWEVTNFHIYALQPVALNLSASPTGSLSSPVTAGRLGNLSPVVLVRQGEMGKPYGPRRSFFPTLTTIRSDFQLIFRRNVHHKPARTS